MSFTKPLLMWASPHTQFEERMCDCSQVDMSVMLSL